MYELIMPGLYLVGSNHLTHNADCQVYLLETGPASGGTGGGVLIDAGADPEATGIIQNLDVLGIRPTHLVLTHGHIDHIGGAQALKAQYGLRVLAHHNDADIMESYDPIRSAAGYYGLRYPPVKVDAKITGDVEFTIGTRTLRLMEMPGHTPGSIAVFTRIGKLGVLFGQDMHGPFNPVWDSDRNLHSESLGRLKELNADILCEGHYGVIRTRQRVRDYIQSHRLPSPETPAGGNPVREAGEMEQPTE